MTPEDRDPILDAGYPIYAVTTHNSSTAVNTARVLSGWAQVVGRYLDVHGCHALASSSAPADLRLLAFGSGLSRPAIWRRRHMATAQASRVSIRGNSTP